MIFKMNWNIDLNKKTATSINGITFKLVESAPDVFHWECVNPKDIPPPEDAIWGERLNISDVDHWTELTECLLKCAFLDKKDSFKSIPNLR